MFEWDKETPRWHKIVDIILMALFVFVFGGPMEFLAALTANK